MSSTRSGFGGRLIVAIVVAALAAALLPSLTGPSFAQEQRARRWSLFDLFAPPRRLERAEPRPVRRAVAKKPRKKVRKAAPAEPEIVIADKAADARTVLVIGDFLAAGVAEGLSQLYAQERRVKVRDRTKGSSGFVRSDVYDWPSEIDALIEKEQPTVIVVMIGSNDRQQMKVNGSRETAGTPAWTAEYTARVQKLAERLTASRRPFLWVGMPSFKSAKMSSDMAALNAIYGTAAEKGGGQFIDIWEGFVDENGAFVSTGPDISGQTVRLRSSDGVNMTAAGRRKMAFYVQKPLNRVLGIGPGGASGPNLLQPSGPDGAPALPALDRTAPISLMDPDLDGGADLLGAVVKPARKAGGRPAAIGGVAPTAQSGRADNFAFGPAQPGLAAEETAAR